MTDGEHRLLQQMISDMDGRVNGRLNRLEDSLQNFYKDTREKGSDVGRRLTAAEVKVDTALTHARRHGGIAGLVATAVILGVAAIGWMITTS